MTVLSIQSHVTYGHVGNAAAVFALQRLGHEVWPLHTVNFATHTGYGPPTGFVATAETIRAAVARLDALGVLGRCDAVLTGYAGSAEIGEALLDAVAAVKARNPSALWCCDPVMGDSDRGLFVEPDVAAFFTRHAFYADLLLPNAFELDKLCAGGPGNVEIAAACQALLGKGPRCVIVTGLADEAAGTVATLAATASGGWRLSVPAIPLSGRPNGAGDLFAAVFLGKYLSGAPCEQAACHAAGSVHGVLRATASAGSTELCLVAAQEEIVDPALKPQADKLW